MRRILLASCVALMPALAFAQTAATTPPPPAASDDDAGPGPMGPMDGSMGGPMGGPGMGWGGKHGRQWMDPGAFLTQFYAANTTHDGHLTMAQAKSAGFQPVVDHFTDIDVSKRGYVTFYDIQAWQLDDMAKRLEKKAADLRAKD